MRKVTLTENDHWTLKELTEMSTWTQSELRGRPIKIADLRVVAKAYKVLLQHHEQIKP